MTLVIHWSGICSQHKLTMIKLLTYLIPRLHIQNVKLISNFMRVISVDHDMSCLNLSANPRDWIPMMISILFHKNNWAFDHVTAPLPANQKLCLNIRLLEAEYTMVFWYIDIIWKKSYSCIFSMRATNSVILIGYSMLCWNPRVKSMIGTWAPSQYKGI